MFSLAPLRGVFTTLFYREVEAWRGDFAKEPCQERLFGF